VVFYILHITQDSLSHGNSTSCNFLGPYHVLRLSPHHYRAQAGSMAAVQQHQASTIEISVKAHDIGEQHDALKSHIINITIDGAQITPVTTRVTNTTEKPSEELVERLEPRSLTWGEVSEHKNTDDLWIVVDNGVYDVTRFQHDHPGGHKGNTLLPFR
jgi:cytochrome b involved in lipid metabolism